jgi:hypothetical protein
MVGGLGRVGENGFPASIQLAWGGRVRRIFGPVALAAAALLLLAGCGKPAGTDGDLVNGWAMLPTAKIVVPTAPACYDSIEDDLSAVTKWPAPVDCTASHNVELIYVGQFTGAAGDATTPPASGGADRKTAYQTCAAQAKTYLGDDWRNGSLELNLDLPVATLWEAGARWYRCDLQQYKDLNDYGIADLTASLKGSLSNPTGNVRLGCVAITETSASAIDKMLPISCTTAHNGEYAGVWDAPDGPYPDDATARRTANLNGCRGVVSAYAGIPNDNNFTYRTGQVATPFNKAEWELGNRGVRCYIWLNKSVSTTLKGAGAGGLPINYG